MSSIDLSVNDGASRFASPANLRLRAPRAETPPERVADAEAALALWPLLRDGAPRTLLLGKLIVGLGIDSASAAKRLEGVLSDLGADSFA